MMQKEKQTQTLHDLYEQYYGAAKKRHMKHRKPRANCRLCGERIWQKASTR